MSTPEDILYACGADHVDPGPSSTKFRTGRFRNGGVVRIARYADFGGWQVEFSASTRDERIGALLSAGYNTAVAAPGDKTRSRVALGLDEEVIRAVVKHLVREAGPLPGSQDSDSRGAPIPTGWPPADIRSFDGIYTPAECSEFAARGFTPAAVRSLLGM